MADNHLPLSTGLQLAALRLLASSWHDIDYRYAQLTEAERQLLTEAQFKDLFAAMLEAGIVRWPR